MRYALFAVSMMLLVSDGQAQDVARDRYQDIRPLMVAAIDAPGGQSFGILSGQVADALTQKFGGTSPIYIDVSTERRFRQTGCSRLKVLFWQDGVLLPGAPAPRKQTIEFGLNYCRDGSAPKALS